jgi:hypothetical protein
MGHHRPLLSHVDMPNSRGRGGADGVGVDSGGGGTAVVWFRLSDLRVMDHEPLTVAHTRFDRVLHVFCFEPWLWGACASPAGATSLGHHERAQGV